MTRPSLAPILLPTPTCPLFCALKTTKTVKSHPICLILHSLDLLLTTAATVMENPPPALVPLPLWRSQEWRAAQHAGPVTRIVPLPSSNKLATGGRDGMVRVFRAADLHPLQICAASDGAWVADAVIATLDGQQRLAVSTLDRAISFFNVLPAERDPHRPDETSCLGLAGRLHAPVAFGPATALAALPGSEERLALGDQAGGLSSQKTAPNDGQDAGIKP